MLISCISCNSKYLINSADLKPDGRMVECVKCRKRWFQEIISNESIKNIAKMQSNLLDLNKNKPTANLPSTFVKEQKVSMINSILVILLLSVFVSSFWILRNIDMNNFVLFKFYINEFIFNLNLIVDDVVKIIYQIFN